MLPASRERATSARACVSLSRSPRSNALYCLHTSTSLGSSWCRWRRSTAMSANARSTLCLTSTRWLYIETRLMSSTKAASSPIMMPSAVMQAAPPSAEQCLHVQVGSFFRRELEQLERLEPEQSRDDV